MQKQDRSIEMKHLLFMPALAVLSLTIGLGLGILALSFHMTPVFLVFLFVGIIGFFSWAIPYYLYLKEISDGQNLTILTKERDSIWYPRYLFESNPTADRIRELDQQINLILGEGKDL